jgi:hypothetical protein
MAKDELDVILDWFEKTSIDDRSRAEAAQQVIDRIMRRSAPDVPVEKKTRKPRVKKIDWKPVELQNAGD